ncbi:hypothetical protein diail_8144 [Diaporthe ilicicola]|nr:hypothetical protein diail_8144 [Diaporthe ilicicola]
MAEHWIHVRDLMTVLVALLYGQDDDGIDLYFTSSKDPVGTFHEPKQFLAEMNRHRPKHGFHRQGSNSVQNSQSDFLPPDSAPRAVTASTASSNELEENITDVLGEIRGKWSNSFMEKENEGAGQEASGKAAEERGLSIQFVRFGHDEAAIEALEYMDKNLTGTDDRPLPDIIDHEPADGNIDKMILGSLDSRYNYDSVGDVDDDRQTVMIFTETDERGELGKYSAEPTANGSVRPELRPLQEDCVACKAQGLSCSYTTPRKTRFYGSLEDLSDRYKCLDAIVRGAFPNQPVDTAADLVQLAQRLQINIPDLSLDDYDSFDVLLRDGAKTYDGLSSSHTPPGHRKSVDSGFDSVTQDDGHRDDASGKKEETSIQDQKVGLLRDTSGHEHYIGPSGSLQFLDQLRRLLISREAEISTGQTSQLTSDSTRDDASQVLLDPNFQFSEGPQIAKGAVVQCQNVSPLEDSLSPQANGSTSSGMEPTDEIQELMDQIPELEMVESLLHVYWNNVHEDFPLFHRDTFENEYQAFLGNSREPAGQSPNSGVARPDHGWIGCLHMMVVFGSLSSASHHDETESKVLQKHCVDSTRKLLPRIVTKCSLSGVRALLLLSLFLHNDNERNAAWNLAGTATRICFALGLHRNDTSELFSPIERETRRRVFCTLYGFEQFLASSLGRPSGVNDIDVQVVHPHGGVLSGNQESDDALAIMTLKLNRILSTSRNPRYAPASAAQAPHEAHHVSVEEVLASLKAWKTELSYQQGLDVPVITEKDDKLPVTNGPRMELSELNTLLGWRTLPSIRAIILLNIQYHYICILVTRPFLLRSITASGRTGHAMAYDQGASTTIPNKVGQFSDMCFRHACQMARLLLLLDSFELVRGTSGLDVFFAYSAAMILILRSLRLESYQQGPAVKPDYMEGTSTLASGHMMSQDLDEKLLLVALRELIVRLRELVLKVPKSSTMERFARAMVAFEESAYHIKINAGPGDSELDPRSFMPPAHIGSHISAPNLLFRGLMDASYGPRPSDGVPGMDARMQDSTAAMMHDQQQQFFGYGSVLPATTMGTFSVQPSGLAAFDCLPGLNPWVMNGNQAAQQGTEMPIYGWEDLESMLGNGRSHPRRF